VIGEALALLGSVLVLLASVGMLRFGDPLARMHALAKASTLGVLLLLGGAAVNLEDVNDLTSVLLAALLQVIASPPASNMVSRATYLAGAMQRRKGVIDEGARPLGLDGPADAG
jgi:multicomponent Na+:H+ antiporter subunit G